jgi:hypothetical protein
MTNDHASAVTTPGPGHAPGPVSAVLCSELTYRFGAHTAVNQVDLRIGAGETFGLLGPNGAGKTTTIRMLTTLLKPVSGTVTVFGTNAAAHPMRVRRIIGSVPQLLSADATLTGWENCSYSPASSTSRGGGGRSVSVMPGWLQAISKHNPLSYEVDALRGLLVGVPANLWLDTGVLAGATVAGITAAALLLPRLAK